MVIGKKQRWRRFLYPCNRLGLIVPMDHGLTVGPIPGLQRVADVAGWIRHPAITGVIAHKGIAERLIDRELLGSAGLMIHLNGMSTLAAAPDRKEMVTSVETAIRLGAEGVSVQVNFDGKADAQNLSSLGAVVDRCLAYGLPVLTMVYDKVPAVEEGRRIDRLRHLMRIAVELGTDAIKIAPPSRLEGVAPLLEGISDDAAVFFAGGALSNDEQLFTLTKEALACGAAGLCVGRNIFQRPAPGEFLNQLSRLIRLPEETVPAVREVLHGLH